MADLKDLQTKLDSLLAEWQADKDIIEIRNAHQHEVCLCLDEIRRQIDTITNGEKTIVPKTVSEVAAEIQASKEIKIEP